MNNKQENKKPHWNTANKSFYRDYVAAIRDLKQNMTTAELLLWDEVRNKKLGVKFRRQYVIGSYVPDFAALSIKLIVEVDGKIHLNKRKEDAERTEWFELNGYNVIRFANEEVENDIKKVIETIKLEINKLGIIDNPTQSPQRGGF